jgi:hypothetical protein
MDRIVQELILPRVYMPLNSVAEPPPLSFSNGVQIVSRDSFKPPQLVGWEEVFSLSDLKQLRNWHLAIAYDWDANAPSDGRTPENRLQDTRLALQVAAPVGTFVSVCIREQDDSENPRLMTTRLEEFSGTTWSRRWGFNNLPAIQVEAIVNGVIRILNTNDARTINPIRLFEQGLISHHPYIRIFLWVTAIDSILMAVNKARFIQRLSSFFGPASPVFAPSNDSLDWGKFLIEDLAEDLYVLRSEVAHGRAIGETFWKERADLNTFWPWLPQNDPPRYLHLLEEAALSLISRILRKIIVEDLVLEFTNAKAWRAHLG